MNFVAQVEDHLRDLGAEARKNHPGIKEASERAILHLRSLQTQYVAAVRRAGASKSPPSKVSPAANDHDDTTVSSNNNNHAISPIAAHPTTSLFKSHDVLRPFLLALNHPDISHALANGAMEAIQLLLRGDAVQSTDGVYIAQGLYRLARECRNSSVATSSGGGFSGGAMALGLFRGSSSADSHHRVLTLNQRAAKEEESMAFKILQTMTMLVDSRSVELSAEVLGQCLLGILVLVNNGSSNGAGEYEEREGTVEGIVGGNVRRTALATMNQVLSILFERGRDVMLEGRTDNVNVASLVEDRDESTVLNVAQQTLVDLVDLVQNSYRLEKKKKQITGPFAAAVKEKMGPTPAMCLSLIDMIFKQRAIDFFRVCQWHCNNPRATEEGNDEHGLHVQFALHSIQLTSQLVLSILQTQQSKSYTTTNEFGETSDSVSFCYFYYATSLGCTILANYLTPCSLDFYQKMDSIQLANDNATSQIMSCNALKMLQLLVGYVSAATDAYHNSEFEDGYIFNQTERASLNIGKDEEMSAADDLAKGRKSQTGVTQATPDPLVSNDQLWRAFLSLEVIYSLMCSHLKQMALLDSFANGSNSVSSDNDSKNNEYQTIISAITKATSDLATISGSNRERILHVVLIAHDDTSAIGEPSKAAASLAEKFSDSQAGRSAEVPICDTGLATWLSFKCVLALVKSLKEIVLSLKRESVIQNSQQSDSARQILKQAFAPSVSVLQHYIKRMSGSHVVVKQTLSAYENLAYASMVLDSIEENLRRHTILTSLCKLCLPSWGKNCANSQLKESNIDSLWVLLRIVHEQFNDIYEEWHTILSTMDQLATLSIKSSKLPVSYYTKASNIGESLARLPKFTTCFSNEALSYFIASLVSLSKLVSLSPLVEQTSDLSRQNSESFDYDTSNGRGSISGKLISFAGRSLGFGGGSAHTTASNPALRRAQSVDSAAPPFSKVYSDDLREASCMLMMTMKISTPRSTIRKLPLPLLLLCVVVEANSYRFKVIEEALALHLCDLVANSTAPEYRKFAMEILIDFIPLSLSKSSESGSSHLNQPISAPTKQSNKPLDVIPFQQAHDDVEDFPLTVNKVHLLQILCDTILQSRQPETAETGLSALHTVLEGASHNLSGDNLVGVIETLSGLSGSLDQDVDRSIKSWSTVTTKSFQIFKLIFDDFLEPDEDESSDMPSDSTKERQAIINCCVSFGKSRHDVNISLTATGMLWTLADQDPTPGTLNLVLSKLSCLALDDRPELRNCAVNTLISCAVGRGHQFTNEQWERVLNQTIFGIIRDISGAINGSENEAVDGSDKGNQRYQVAVHHSRDSATKQWSTTLVLTLRGLERVLRLFFPRLLSTTSCDKENPWFLFTWTEILRFSLESATLSGGRETLEIRLAGVELITLCAQLACKSGMVASANAARVGTNMEVVGGALRSVRAAIVQDEREVTAEATPLGPEVEAWRTHLFNLAFSSLVNDFQDHLSSSHDTDETTEHYMIDSVSTQVLNKLASELAKLYECCKNDEMQPGSCELRLDIFAEDDGSNESRFINLLLSMVEKCPSESSRFLNQVQRGVMTLLQSMASNSSLRAFKALTRLSGDRMFVRSKALSTDSDKEKTDDSDEVFELEAARTISNAFGSDDMSDEVRVVVMCSVLLQYLKLYAGDPDAAAANTTIRAAAEARYDFFISVIDSGVEAVSHLDAKCTARSEVLDAIWDRVLAAVTSILLPPPLNRQDAYVYHSKSFLNIVALVLLHIPKRKYAQAELLLEQGAHRAVEVAFECNVSTAAHAPKVVDGAVDVFLACFMGLCQNMPSSDAVQTLTNQILGEIHIELQPTAASSSLSMKTQQSLALAVLESLKASSSDDLLIGLFPLLCRLTNVENDGLRRAAGAILGGVNISEAILRERRRAEESETRAREIEEENNALLEEVDFLHAENEELQRQLAVFSESSDFT